MMMKSLHRTAMLCACVAVFIVAPAPCNAQETAFMRDEDGFAERIEQDYEVKPGGSLTLEAEIGSIRVDGWTNDEVEIRIEKRVNTRREERARSAFDEIDVILSRRENDVHIRVVNNDESIFFRNRVSVDMTVRVPESCSLDLTTVDGNIGIDAVKSPVTARVVDGDIEIRKAEGQTDAGTTDGNIEIEEVTGSITARAVDGDIEIRNTRGSVTARTTDGDVEIRNTRGTITANAVDGNIDIRHVTGEVSARTTDGDIEIRDAQSAVNVDAVDGNIETWNTEGSVDASTLEGDIGIFETLGAVTAKALRGNIDVEVARTNRDLDTRCDLDTTEGDVTIYLPHDLPATIEAEGSSGGLVLSRLWRRDIGHIYSDFGMNKSELGVFFYIQSEANSDINGGGDRFRLSTDSGNIHIKKRNR